MSAGRKAYVEQCGLMWVSFLFEITEPVCCGKNELLGRGMGVT